MAVIEMEDGMAVPPDLVGPVMRGGNLADAVVDAIEADNPGVDVLVFDQKDYVRVHTAGQCRLTRASLVEALGRPFDLASLEIDMPAFKGRMATHTDEYVWFYSTTASS